MKGDSKSEENARNVPGSAYYGTFQGTADYPPPAIGFPQPVPPPGVSSESYYPHGYQAVPGYPGPQGYPAVATGRPVRQERLPCCGIGIGWALFIAGFILATIPWYVGTFIFLCVRQDYREKPGLVACTIAAILSALAVILGATKGADVW